MAIERRKKKTAKVQSIFEGKSDEELFDVMEDLLGVFVNRGFVSKDRAEEWTGLLKEGEMDKEGKGYVIRVALGPSGLYRHIKVPRSMRLIEFSFAILDAYQFDMDHLSAFFMDNRAWSDADAYFFDEINDGSRVMGETELRDVGLEKGKKFLYIFDFGDEWTFQCKVLREVDDAGKNAEIVKSVGEAPQRYPVYDDDFDDLDLE